MIYEKIDNLIDLFLGGNAGLQEIKYVIDEYINYKKIDIISFFREYIADGIANKNGDRVEFTIILSDLFDKNKSLLDIYENLLFENWHNRHEDIVDIISQYGNVSSIPSLIKCFDMEFEYMKYNNFYSFHKKLIWAIQKLDCKNYKEYLRSISKKVSPKLRAEINK